MKSNNYTLWTNDVETTSIWFNTLRDKTGEKVLREGMPELLDIYDNYNIKSTFFYTYYIANKFPDIVKIAAEAGHEIASHGKSHLKENGFDVMPFERQKRHLIESKKLLEDISGQEIISFRAPALRVNEETAQALIEAGYKIDSSIASQRFDFFLSFGGRTKLNWLKAPRKPYMINSDNIFKKGIGPLIEIPLSAFVLPYLGTTMRVFPGITNMQKWFIHYESSLTGKPVVFDIHPNEFIDESDEPRKITSRSKNPVAYFLQDWLRSNLKVKNLGPEARPIYEQQIKFFKDRGYKSTTIKQYCKEIELI
tara:strand:+ start:1715 stop:2641 length:927 start_codon:yes stop_codon:yes gene_type:complete